MMRTNSLIFKLTLPSESLDISVDIIENFNQDMPGLLRYIDQVRKIVRNFEKKYSTCLSKFN